MNITMLTGNLTSDPELRYAATGTAILSYNIAVNEKYGDKVEVLFIGCVMFGKFAEVMNQYLLKGSKVAVSGSLKQDNWTDQSGVKRSKISLKVDKLELIGCKKDSNGGGNSNYNKEPVRNTYPASAAPAGTAPTGNAPEPIPEIDVDDDNIPF